ncbi:MAG: lipid exporter, fused ATPase and inner rane subunit MsbA [Gammaproteobacteria bacterium]|nr:lipid exporter, fused ATPase and inner rane subunit MsbA [Gammaproteobacteria bacterium]
MTKSVKDTQLYLRLLRYVIPYRQRFYVSILSMLILAATDPAIPALMKPMLDGAFINKDPELIYLIPVLFVGLFIIRGAATYINGMSLRWVAFTVMTDLRSEMFLRMLSFPSQYYDHHTGGMLMSKFTYDVIQIQQAATNAVTTLIRDFLAIIGLIAWMFYIDWRLTLIALICAPFIVLIVLSIRNRLRKMSQKAQESMADIHHVLGECIEGQKLVKLYGGQAQEIERFNVVIRSNRRYMMKFAMAAIATGPAVQLISAIALAVIIYIAAIQASTGALSIGEFVSFFGAMAMLLAPLKRLVSVNEHIQKGLAACESIFSLLDEQPETDSGTRVIEHIKGDIEFRNVNFRYDGKETDALQNISLHISPGETVALVGSSGSGKTTVANLLPGFYDVSNGEILLDGIDLREITLASLRANIALVSQEVVLFNDTVRNNIAYGALHNSKDEDIIEAARAAHALEFIQEMPDGFETIIGEKGMKLSGGQRQRLAIARAILKNAPILILDEATSSLDRESERQIQSALDRIKKGRTCIVIAHRLSTIEKADRILVIDRGRIVQTGKHSDLLKQDGVYARLHRVQFTEPVN